MKLKAVIFSVLLLFLVAGLYHFSSYNFLPWMRYRSISVRHPYVSYNIVKWPTKDGNERMSVSSTQCIERVLVPWFGNTATEKEFLDGIGPSFGLIDVSGYDTNIVRTSRGRLFPKQPGTTKLVARFASGVDSIYIQVSREDWGLAIHQLNR